MAKTAAQKAAAAKAAAEKTAAEKTAAQKAAVAKAASKKEKLSDLENYFNCTTKKELKPIMDEAIKKIKSLEYMPDSLLNFCEENQNTFNELSEKPKDFLHALKLTGVVIGQLNVHSKNPLNK